jgi:Na+/melibiose symporter-like transporter
MSDINKAPNGFFSNYENLQKVKYKEVIETHVRKNTEERMMNAIIFEIQQMPKATRKEFEFSTDYPAFWLGIQSVFKNKEWWKNITITEAMKFFLQVAKDTIPYFNKSYTNKEDLDQKAKNQIFGLYQMVTLFISYHAQKEKKLRETFGIKKGIFTR